MKHLILLAILLSIAGCITSTPPPTIETTTTSTSTTILSKTTGITPPKSTTTVGVPVRDMPQDGVPSYGTTTAESTTTLPALEIPPEVLENCIGFLAGSPDELQTIRLAGAGWARPHPGPFSWQNIQPAEDSYDYTLTDSWVKAAQENNIGLLATIWSYASWDQAKCHKGECVVSTLDQFYPQEGWEEFSIPASRCKPCNMQAYSEFVEKLVERYDGDGVGDMPSLSMPVKYWEASNEPFLREDFLTFFKGTPEEYLNILEATYIAVKKACPDCKVLHAGAAHIQPDEMASWRKVFQKNGTNFFDISNIHYISSGDKNTMNVKDFKKLVDEFVEKPIWLTEAEIKSVNDLSTMTDGALNAGAQKIFYTTIAIGQKGPPKPGQYTQEYKNMKEKCRQHQVQ